MTNFQKIAYKRVSSIDQNTSRQLEGMTFDKIFEDKLSGKSKDRPQLEAMLQYVREGDQIYVHSMDRLARNLKDLLDIVNLVTDKGCSIHFVSQALVFSKKDSSPTSKLMLQILGSIYEFELQLIHERQREGIELAKKNGKYKTGRPVKMTADKIKICHEKRAQGVPITRIAKDLGVSTMTIYRELRVCQSKRY